MNMKSVCLCVLVFSLRFVRGQLSTTPCTGVFEGYNETSREGKIIVMKPSDHPSVSVLEVRINFTIVGPLINDYKGHFPPGLTDLVRKYNQGETLIYRVHFPVTQLGTPKVTAVIVNGDILCTGPGDDRRLSKLIQKMTLWYRTKLVRNDKPVTSRPVINSAVTKQPIINNRLPEPRPVVTASSDHHLSNFPITTDECGVVAVGGNGRVPLVNNGKFYERGEIPWLVAIYRVVEKNLLFICGGTLVSDRHVVTAAHCMQRPFIVTPKTEVVVKVGVHSLNEWSDNLAVIRKLIAATIHKEYDANTLQNDILILTLNERVKFNRYIRPACLWSGDTELSRVVGAAGIVAGWGDRSVESIGGKPDEPQMVRVPIVSTTECRASKSDFHQLTYNTTLCAGDRNGAGPCKGDSGGGLYLLAGGKWRLRGIVSISVQSQDGTRTCNLNEYVVYTDTAQFLPWIRDILSQKYYD